MMVNIGISINYDGLSINWYQVDTINFTFRISKLRNGEIDFGSSSSLLDLLLFHPNGIFDICHINNTTIRKDVFYAVLFNATNYNIIIKIWNIAKGTTDPGVDYFDH